MSFPSTHWSVIAEVREGAATGQQLALDALVERYWNPAYAHLRARGIAADDAQDLVQDFFERWLRRNLFGRADACRGRFRDFFLTSLNNFVRNALRDRHAGKRWPEAGFVADDIEGLHDGTDPAEAFVRTFTSELTLAVLAQLERDLQASGSADHFEIFRRRMVEPVLDGVEPPPYRDLAAEFGITEKQAANRLTTVRRAYGRLLEERIAEYAASPEDRAQELAELLAYLGIRD
jgi:RNA polymerase sigma factor (sigma-70 family)